MKKTKIFSFGVTLTAVLGLIFNQSVLANNLSLAGFSDVTTDTTGNTITYNANVTWDNAWYNTRGGGPFNNDAIWIFLKYSTDAGLTWNHATMKTSGTNPAGFTNPSGFNIKVPTDLMGFFLEFSGENSGTATATGVRFVWDYNEIGRASCRERV